MPVGTVRLPDGSAVLRLDRSLYRRYLLLFLAATRLLVRSKIRQSSWKYSLPHSRSTPKLRLFKSLILTILQEVLYCQVSFVFIKLLSFTNSFRLFSLSRYNVTCGSLFSSPCAVVPTLKQGCIIRSILPSGMGARGVSSEHVENMEMFSCSPT